MMAQSKNSKEMFVVNFREIPETICVETRFITKANAKLKEGHTLFYMNVNRVGQIELSKNEVPPPTQVGAVASAQLKNISSVRSKQPVAGVTVSIRNKPLILSKPITVTSVMTNTNIPQSQHPPPYSTPAIGGHGVNVTSLGSIRMSAPYSTNMLPETSSLGVTPSSSRIPASLSAATVPLSNPIIPNMNFNSPVLMKKTREMKDSCCMTEPKAQVIHRGQQTDLRMPITSSVAIQCCMDDFNEDFDMLDTVNSPVVAVVAEKTEEEEKEAFLKYVSENSVEYKNHYMECLICGEVCKNYKYFYGHMAIHQGPTVLCFRCGEHLEHEALLKTHICASTNRISRALLRCPQYKCKVTAISRLELYDHINEHRNFRDHKCSACGKKFCTAQEFLRHLLLRAKCYTEAKRNRNRLYGLRSETDRLCRVRVFTLHTYKKRTSLVKSLLSARTRKRNLCEICFRSYNRHIFKLHIKKCSKSFREHTSRKNQKKK